MTGFGARHTFRSTTLQACAFVAVLSGLGLARGGLAIPAQCAWLAMLFSCIVWRRRDYLALAAVVALGLSLGLARGHIYQQELLRYQDLDGQKVNLRLVAREDASYGSHSQLTFSGNDIRLDDGQRLRGTISVSSFGLPAIFEGDRLEVSGKLRIGRGQYQGFMSYAQIALINRHPSSLIELRRKFTAAVHTALPEPQASFAMGLLIGQRADLPDETKQDLLMTGLTHIIAVSGYNLTIMVESLRRLLGERSKRVTTGLSLLFILTFVLLAGGSASIVRAAVISVLSIWASYYGRTFRPLNLILLGAILTAWANPFYIWSDISWYLSFLAFYGILILAPALRLRLPRLIPSIAIETMSAELMTMPLIIFVFGQTSLIGLLGNMLVASFVPLAMLLGLIAGIAALIATIAVGYVALPARMLLTVMLETAHLLASLPHIFLEHLQLTKTQFILTYATITSFSLMLYSKTKLSVSDKITDKNQANEGV